MSESFEQRQMRIVEICSRIDARAGLLSEDAYFPQRTTAAAPAEVADAKEHNQADAVTLLEAVAAGLAQHRDAMVAWAEQARGLGCSPSYVEGWQEIVERWRARGHASAPPRAYLPWLVTMWARATSA